MRKLKEIIDELWAENLEVNIPVERTLEIAIQIQRNEILEESLFSGSLNDISGSMETLKDEIWALNKNLERIEKKLKD